MYRLYDWYSLVPTNPGSCVQEELKILRLRYSLLVEEELETRENELNRLLEETKQSKVLSHDLLHNNLDLFVFVFNFFFLNKQTNN